jgi:hypothetical protein
MTRKEYICVGAYVFSGLRPSRDELRDAMKLKLSGGRTHTRIVLLCNTVTTLGFGRVGARLVEIDDKPRKFGWQVPIRTAVTGRGAISFSQERTSW